MSETSLFLNACGMVNALGSDKLTILKHLSAGDVCGVVPWDIKVQQDKTVYVGQVKATLPQVPNKFKQFDCRNNELMLAAIEQIQVEVEELKSIYTLDRIAIVLGTSTSGILEGENALQAKVDCGQFPASFDYRQQEIGTPALFLREYLGLTGLALTVSTACSSSAKVFASASRLMNSNLCDAIIVGGVEFIFIRDCVFIEFFPKRSPIMQVERQV